ncbi:MAG: YitT family protein [Bacteroidaceae bacterium]|nr:YitT family protein [Bacteroidaceae bacterium]
MTQLSQLKLSYFQEIKDYVSITLGLVMYAIGVNVFQLPYQITGGGVAGVGAILFYGFSLPQAYTFFIVNIFLLILAIRILGWKFCIKTIYAVVVLTFLLELGRQICYNYGQAHLGEFVLSPNGMPQIVKDNAFMSAILGASIEGIGLGIVFLNNGSTGGTDIIAAIVNKYRDVTLGQVIMFFDILIITSSGLLPSIGISEMLYGYCTLIVSSILLDYVVDRGRQSVQFLIFSEKYGEIADAITSTGRGVTVLNGEGWFTHTDRKVLCVLAKKRESTNIFRFIQSIDPNAFVSQSKVIGVFGEGFDRIKAKKNKEDVATPKSKS